jgi:hypothetical protein
MVWISALEFWCKAALILPSPISAYECTNSAGEREILRKGMWRCDPVLFFELGWNSLKLQREHSAIPVSSSKLHSVCWWQLCYITTVLTNIQRKKEGKKERKEERKKDNTNSCLATVSTTGNNWGTIWKYRCAKCMLASFWYYTFTECCLAIYFVAKVDTALTIEAWVHFTAYFLTQ